MPLPEKLLRAYLNTNYRVYDGDHVEILRIGEPSEHVRRTMIHHAATSACLITAWNPLSQRYDESENMRRNHLLATELRTNKLTFLRAAGGNPDDSWPVEESFLVLGPGIREVLAWCRTFQQHAAVWIPCNGVPILLLQDGTFLEEFP